MLAIIASGRIGYNRRDFSKKINKNFIQNIFCDFDEKLVDEILKIARHNVDSKSKDEIFYLEIELSRLAPYFKDYELSNETNKFVKYSDISEFPSSTRDLSVLVGRIEDIEKVSKIIDDHNASILVDRFLFDFYENKEKNQIKVAYRLIFQSKENTLGDKDVDKEMNKMVSKIIEIKMPLSLVLRLMVKKDYRFYSFSQSLFQTILIRITFRIIPLIIMAQLAL